MSTEHLKYVKYLLLIVVYILIPAVWIGFGVWQFKKRGKTDILLLFLLFVCWLFYGRYVLVHLDPPAHVATLAEFMKKTGGSYHITLITVNNKKFFEVREPWPPFKEIMAVLLTLRSGPPSCVFDQEGYMIDWAPDSDEDPRYYKKWIKGPTDRKAIPFEEALELIEQWAKEQKKT